MIIKEFYRTRKDGVNLYKNYSDEQYMIQKVGTNEVYSTAIDVESALYEYVETEEKIKEIEEQAERTQKEEAVETTEA